MTSPNTKINPWGNIEWLLPKMGVNQWKGVFCASFEPRCTAVAEWLSTSNFLGENICLRIKDPENRYSKEIESITDVHEAALARHLKKRIEIVQEDLLAEPGIWYKIVNQIASESEVSILLDISSLPKRVFLFAVKRLMSLPNVKDLVICYTRPEGYKEGQFTEDAEPPAALPGFGRINESSGDSTVIVSVGYMAFNLAELLEQNRGKSPKFIFPFPPGSPGFRRSWKLLHELAPALDRQTEIKRIHAMDLFAALEWIRVTCRETARNIDFIPLGPKPHALAMALAFPEFSDRSEILYSQPRLYHPNYSYGVLKNAKGIPDITAYCLRRNYVNCV